MTLLLDIGNSRIKWALDEGTRLTGHGEAAWRERGLATTIAAEWNALSRPTRVLASSVLDEPLRAVLCDWIAERWRLPVDFVASHASACGVTNAYTEPARLGVDRFAALVAAHAIGRRASCVVDCGTAMTVDALAGDGQHLGGLIAPGVATMRRSLLVDTRGIREIEGDSRILLARNTGTAVAAGTAYALVALVDRVVYEMQTELGEVVTCVMTGGDAPLLRPLLSVHSEWHPDLVLRGVRLLGGRRLMRWLFYLLLAGNALLFGSEIRQLEPTAAVDLPMTLPTTVNRLLLLSELEDGALRERRAARPPAPVESAPEPEPAPAPVEDVAVVAPAAGAVASPVPPLAGVAPMTLEEAVAAATRGLGSAPPPTPEPPVSARRLCYSVGPLENDIEVEGMREWLVARGGEPRLREDERREIALYWVHFPPLPDRDAAVERVERMREEGIDDIFIIPGGDMRNAVSLGVYRRPESLERRMSELRAKGYDPSVSNRYRTSVAAWFDVMLPDGFAFDGEVFAARFPSAQLEPVGCG